MSGDALPLDLQDLSPERPLYDHKEHRLKMRFLWYSLLGMFLAHFAWSMTNDMAVRQERSLTARQSLPRSPPPTDQAFIKTALAKQNAIRKKYGVPALTWNSTLAAASLTKSNACKVNHAGPYGENVYWLWFTPVTTVPNFTTYTEKAFDAWASAKEISAYKKGDLLGGGHFTQSVWRSSKQIGCAWSTTRCTKNPNQDWYFTCDYSPRGNIKGSYGANVPPV